MWSSTINWLFGFAEPAEQEPTVLEESVSLEERKIDWIFVGLGEVSWNLAECIASSTSSKLCGVVSVERNSGSQFVSQFGTVLWSKEEGHLRFIKNVAVDVAFISGPIEERLGQCMWALEMGWHVVVESPFSLIRQDAEMITELARRSNRLFMEITPGSFCPGVSKLAEIVASKVIGRVNYLTLNYSPSKFEELIEFRSQTPPFIQHISWALSLINTIFSQHKPTSISTFSDTMGSRSQVLIQAKYLNCQMASVSLSSFVQFPGNGTVFGSTGTLEISQPWWRPESIKLRRSRHFDPVDTDANGSPVKTTSTDSETSSIDLSDSPERDIHYAWSNEHLQFRVFPDRVLSREKLAWTSSSRSSDRGGEPSRLPHTPSRISDDGSLRGWVNDPSDSPTFTNRSQIDTFGDPEDGDFDLSQAALAAASASPGDLSDYENGSNVAKWMAENPGSSFSSGRVKSRKGHSPLWSPWIWPFRRAERGQYETTQMKLLIEEVAKCIEYGHHESKVASHNSTIFLAEALEAVVSQLQKPSVPRSSSLSSVNRPIAN